jgi:hypothetical protein
MAFSFTRTSRKISWSATLLHGSDAEDESAICLLFKNAGEGAVGDLIAENGQRSW